jgi:hypothetical protein
MKTISYAAHHHAVSLFYVAVVIFLYRFQQAQRGKEKRVRQRLEVGYWIRHCEKRSDEATGAE